MLILITDRSLGAISVVADKHTILIVSPASGLNPNSTKVFPFVSIIPVLFLKPVLNSLPFNVT